MTDMKKIIYLIFLAVTIFRVGNGLGEFRLTLISFKNPNGWDQEKKSCDILSMDRGCDTKLELKFSSKKPILSSDTIIEKTVITKVYEKSNNVYFGDDYNPIILTVSDYQGVVYLFVSVVDVDRNGDDQIDIYHVILSATEQGKMYHKIFSGMSGHTKLEMKFRWDCFPNFYQSKCETYCVPNERYDCHSTTGEPMCKSGEHCKIGRLICDRNNPCNNQGVCIPEKPSNSSTCQCPPHYDGLYCKMPKCQSLCECRKGFANRCFCEENSNNNCEDKRKNEIAAVHRKEAAAIISAVVIVCLVATALVAVYILYKRGKISSFIKKSSPNRCQGHLNISGSSGFDNPFYSINVQKCNPANVSSVSQVSSTYCYEYDNASERGSQPFQETDNGIEIVNWGCLNKTYIEETEHSTSM